MENRIQNTNIIGIIDKEKGSWYNELEERGSGRHTERSTVDVEYGQSYLEVQKEGPISFRSGQFNINCNLNPVYDDLGGGGTTVGVTATFSYKRWGIDNNIKSISVTNNVEQSFYFDENGKPHYDAQLAYNIFSGRGGGYR